MTTKCLTSKDWEHRQNTATACGETGCLGWRRPAGAGLAECLKARPRHGDLVQQVLRGHTIVTDAMAGLQPMLDEYMDWKMIA